MAYVFSDEDYTKLEELVRSLLDYNKPLSLVMTKGLAGALLLGLSQAEHIDHFDSVKQVRENAGLDEDVQSMLISGTETFQSFLKAIMNEQSGVIMTKVNGVPWFFTDEMAPEACGMIPSFLNEKDKRPLKEQIDTMYQHGGGWRPQPGFSLHMKSWALRYGKDKPLHPLGGAALHGEIVVVYDSGFTLVMNAEDNFEVCRLD